MVGCTDDTACNYYPFATQDDGSCNYPSGLTEFIDNTIIETTDSINNTIYVDNLSTNINIIPVEYGENLFVTFTYEPDFFYVSESELGVQIHYPNIYIRGGFSSDNQVYSSLSFPFVQTEYLAEPICPAPVILTFNTS